MHETGIAKRIVEQAENQAGGKKIISIKVECGALAHLPAKELQEFMNQFTDYDVKVDEKKAEVECKACGYKGEPKILAHEHDFAVFECPECGQVPEIISGEDIILKEVKLS